MHHFIKHKNTLKYFKQLKHYFENLIIQNQEILIESDQVFSI